MTNLSRRLWALVELGAEMGEVGGLDDVLIDHRLAVPPFRGFCERMDEVTVARRLVSVKLMFRRPIPGE